MEMKKIYTIVVRSDCEEDIEAIGKDVSKLVQKWDGIVVSYNGGVA